MRFVLASLLLFVAGCPEPLESSRDDVLQAQIDSMAVSTTNQPNPHAITWGVAAAVTVDGDWFGSAGVKAPYTYMLPGDRFRIASITKVFTATIILQLADANLVPLDAPLSQWVPGFPSADVVTIGHLLSHRSGIPDYLQDPYIQANLTVPWSAQAILDRVAPAGPFTPGSSTSYSNTNFLLLGLVIEAATGSTYASELHSRITGPLGLSNTGLEGYDAIGFVPGYDGNAVDLTGYIHPSLTWSVGGIISNTADLARFVAAVYEGELFSPAALAAMTTSYGSVGPFGYGLGTIVYTDAHGPAYGHNGSLPGYSTHVSYRRAPYEGAVVLLLNTHRVNADGLAGLVWDTAL